MDAADSDGLAAFKQLLDRARSDPEALGPVTLTEALVGPARSHLLRLCAIPHEFDRETLRILDTSLSADEADRVYGDFSQLSAVQIGSATLSIHERWRKPIFRWWLRPENRLEFQQISRRLADHFLAVQGPADNAAEVESTMRKHFYHLVGADSAEGLVMFESLCRRARHQWRFTECAALIRLAHDYDPILSPPQRAIVGYHEGKLASDLRDWSGAETLFREVESNPDTPTSLRVSALARLGHALREQRRVPDAIASLAQAQTIAQASPDARGLAWRVLLELGEAYRDNSRMEDAERTILEAIEATRSTSESADSAGLYNSLGTIYLRLGEPRQAITAFEKSLAQLERAGDVFRPAQVQNNLALAYCDQRDWAKAEEAFSRSLELKRKAGDLAGQGLALQNLSRAQAAQEKIDGAMASASAAVEIFTRLNDNHHAGIAKHTLGKFQRSRGDAAAARTLFEQAAALLDAAGDAQAAATVRADLRTLSRKVGLPWWAWVGIGVFVFFILLFVIALIFVEAL